MKLSSCDGHSVVYLLTMLPQPHLQDTASDKQLGGVRLMYTKPQFTLVNVSLVPRLSLLCFLDCIHDPRTAIQGSHMWSRRWRRRRPGNEAKLMYHPECNKICTARDLWYIYGNIDIYTQSFSWGYISRGKIYYTMRIKAHLGTFISHGFIQWSLSWHLATVVYMPIVIWHVSLVHHSILGLSTVSLMFTRFHTNC